MQPLSYVVFFKNIVAGALDFLKVGCELVQVSAVLLHLRFHCWEQEKSHHCEMFLCEESFRQRYCFHEFPHALSHAAGLPVLPPTEQILLTHELAQEVSELSQQRLVKCVFLDLLEVMAVDLLYFLA